MSCGMPLDRLYPEHYRDLNDKTQKVGLSADRPACVCLLLFRVNGFSLKAFSSMDFLWRWLW